MTQKTVCVTMPGKHGDSLAATTIARWAWKHYGTKVTWLTSSYCEPLRRLIEYQKWCAEFRIPPEYVLESLGQGGQPWDMKPNPEEFVAIHQCGFRTVPQIQMASHMAMECGLGDIPLDYEWDYPDIQPHTLTGLPEGAPYIVMAPRGKTSFWEVLAEFARRSRIPVVEIGGKGEAIGSNTIDLTGLDFLETVSLMARSRAFVGLMSSQWMLSTGFSISRVGVHNNRSWNVSVGPQTPYNLYPGDPTPEQLVAMTEFLSPPSRCYHPDDMRRLLAESNSVDEMTGHLNGTFYPYHPGRRWEYGLAMQVLKRFNAKTILDVGGAASILPPLAACLPNQKDVAVRLGADVTIVDPCSPHEQFVDWVAEQSRRVNRPLPLVKDDWMNYQGPQVDAVVCISVIEHVPDDGPFFRKLLDHVKVGGVLILTCDFFPDGHPTAGQCRVYTRDTLEAMLSYARSRGFEPFDGEPDWTYRGNFVESYSFASLILERKR